MLINFVIKYAFMAWREHNSSGVHVSVYPICVCLCHFQYIYLGALSFIFAYIFSQRPCWHMFET